MPSRSHGRDKDETLLRWYNAGWQAWWLVLLFVLALAFGAIAGGLGAARGTHRANLEDLSRAYDLGYRAGLTNRATDTTAPAPTSTTTTTRRNLPASALGA